MDPWTGRRRTEQLHRLRQPRSGAPAVPRRVVDPDLAHDPGAAPAADGPQLAMEGNRAERMRRPRQRRERAPAATGAVGEDGPAFAAVDVPTEDVERPAERDRRVVE